MGRRASAISSSDFNEERRGKAHPFALNFDVIAHEIGHLVVFSLVGLPSPANFSGEYRAFHESMADLVAFVAGARLPPVAVSVLQATRGNLYVGNELNRIVELSPQDQIRNVANSVSLYEFAEGWSDEHDLSLPLTGAFFDIFVEVYQRLLVDAGLVPAWVLELADNPERMQAFEHPVQDAHDAAFAADPEAMLMLFDQAVDWLGNLLARLWPLLDADGLTFAGVADAALAAEQRLTGGLYAGTIVESFRWRGIGIVTAGPMVSPWPVRSHVSSARSLMPGCTHGKSFLGA